MNRQDLRPRVALALHALLTDEECTRLIAQSEQRGYAPGEDERAPAVWRSPREADLAELLRTRCIGLLADLGADRIEPALTIYRFGPGQGLAPAGGTGHLSAEGEEARYDLQVYLNEGFEVGATVLFPFEGPLFVQPHRGLGLLLHPALVREEMAVERGRKYQLRAALVCRPPRTFLHTL